MLRTRADKIFDACNGVFMALIMLVVLYPLYFTVIASFSDPYALMRGKVLIAPVGFTIEAYQNVLKNGVVWTGYLNTAFYAGLGTVYALAVTIPTAYALSRKLPGRGFIMAFFVFTMYFSGGMIPSYVLVKQLHLLGTRWVLILPFGISVFNMLIARTFFEASLPEELLEAARIDGANDYRIFFQIALPLSGAIIAVVALYTLVWHWNSYFHALIYLTDESMFPLQLVLRNILLFNQQMTVDQLGSMSSIEMEAVHKRTMMVEVMKYALIFISSLPVLIAYPFVQKYFVKGVMIGALKG